jgi:hypothetical protein
LGRGETRLAAACGAAFAITFTAALALLADLLGTFADSDETFAEYFNSAADRNRSVAGGVLLFVSGVVVMPFLSGLARAADAGSGSQRIKLAGALSPLAGGLVIASAAALATVGASRLMADLFDESSDPFQGSSIVVLPQLGYVLLVFAGWTVGVILALAGSLMIKTRAVAPALGWAAFVCAAILILSPAVTPLVVLPVWALAASVLLFRRTSE